MEASEHSLALEEFISQLRASTVLLMSLQKMVSNSKPKWSPKIAKFESLIFYHNVNAVVWLPVP